MDLKQKRNTDSAEGEEIFLADEYCAGCTGEAECQGMHKKGV